MGTLSFVEIAKEFQKKQISLFSLDDFKRLFEISNQNTLYKIIQRLEKKGFVKRLVKGKYVNLFQKPHDFALANFLLQPSYVSMESALSFYGIISGFSYQIISVTTKKSRKFLVGDREFSYGQIKNDLFWGYEKKENFLIADKEKAYLDFIYFCFKGLREPDFSEFELLSLDKVKVKKYLKKFTDKRFQGFFERLKR